MVRARTTPGPGRPRLVEDGAAVEVVLDGAARRFHAIWLRDNAPEPGTRHPDNGQKLITVLDLPPQTRIAEAQWAKGRLRVRFTPEDLTADFDPDWLAAHAYDAPGPAPPGWTPPHITLWDAAIAEALPVLDFETVRAEEPARLKWLGLIRRFGFARLRNAPTTDGAALDIARLAGFVRETNYGRAFDVRTEARPANLAFTALGLPPHTDNPYRDPPPGLQVLACLRSAVEGGESILVDGFAAARRLAWEDPEAFRRLARYPARFEYAGEAGVRLQAKAPMIGLGVDGELTALRVNARSAAALTDVPYEEMAGFYRAWRSLAEMFERHDLRLRFSLAPGEAMVFDNLRVLHAREAFTSSGARWLQGCYVDRDGLYSTLAAAETEGRMR